MPVEAIPMPGFLIQGLCKSYMLNVQSSEMRMPPKGGGSLKFTAVLTVLTNITVFSGVQEMSFRISDFLNKSLCQVIMLV